MLFKSNRIGSADLSFLENVVRILPAKWKYLHRQINTNCIVGKSRSQHMGNGYFTLILDRVSNDTSNYNLPELITLSGILVWDKKKQDYSEVQLDISFGSLIGFYVKSKYKNLDWAKVDLSQFLENDYGKNMDESRVVVDKYLGDLNSKDRNKLNLGDVFSVEVNEQIYYTIKSMGDGDYVAIDKNGEVFFLTHNPLSVKKIAKTIVDFLNACKNGNE